MEKLMDFKEKLKKISQKDKGRPIDWNQRKVEWVENVDKLYKQVELWFCEYLDEGLMDIDVSKIFLTEDYIGTYEITKLELALGESVSSEYVDDVVVFEPVGRNVIGADGKIDLYLKGRKSEKVLLLLIADEGDEAHWELWKSRKKDDRYQFDETVFEELISDWLNL
jgi:hypothetical protein